MKRALFLFLWIILGWISVASIQAEVYDVGDDWVPLGSGGANPNGVWSYVASDDLTNDNDVLLSPYIEYDANRSAYWGGAEMLWPLIWHSFTYSDGSHNVGDTIVQAANSVYTGPKYAKIRWTAPEDGAVAVAVTFNDDYSHATGGNLHGWVVHNDTVLFGTTSLTTESCIVDVPVAAGDTIDFAVATSGMGEPLSAAGVAVDVDAMIETLVPPTEPVECVLRLDAATGLTDPNTGIPYGDGDVVKRWQDTQSGKAMKANLAWGGPTLETGEINGKNVIRFTGHDGLIVDPNSDPDDLLDASNFTIYVVGRISDLSLSQVFYANYSDPAAGAGLGISDTLKNIVKYYTNFGSVLSPEEELVEGRYYLMAVTRSWLGERNLYINGTLAATGRGKATYNTDTVASIGALDIGRQFLIGDIAEIRVYDGVDATLNDGVTDELLTKYNIDTSPVIADPNIISLTAMTLSRTGPAGGMDSTERWNTLFLDDIWDLALYEGDLITNPALYDPNTPGNFWLNNLTYMMLDIPLRLGEERTFNWHCARAATDVPKMGMNLFFDNGQNQNVPGISVYAQMDDTGPGDGNPPFLPNGAASTMGWPFTSVPGAGSLIYYDTDKSMKVTMTDFVAYHPDVYDLDFIGAQVQGEEAGIHPVLGGNDGAADLIGRFTLKVETLDCSALDHFAGDIDANCRVNLEDIALLLADWLKCNDPENTGCTDVP